MQANEIRVGQAIAASAGHCHLLAQLAAAHRSTHRAIGESETTRHWQAGAGTFCYQTHVAVPQQAPGRLAWLADIFYRAAALERYPWYPQFQGGRSGAVDHPPPEGIDQHQLCWGGFDLGLSAPRYYRQLISLAYPAEQTAVVAARSVQEGPALPEKSRLAYTVEPNGEVLHFEDGCLHWHHICCTTGPAMLPGRLDRWFMNALRLLRLDGAERATYRSEAEQFCTWLQSPQPEVTFAAAVPVPVPVAPADSNQ